jgi:hypothetical protein
MTQRCFKCGRRIEPLNEQGESSGRMIIQIEIWLADAYNDKVGKRLDIRWYCQDCGVLAKTILENWEGE